VALCINYMLGPCALCNVQHVFVLGWFNIQVGDNDCVGNECSDIESELMRQGGRLPEWLEEGDCQSG